MINNDEFVYLNKPNNTNMNENQMKSMGKDRVQNSIYNDKGEQLAFSSLGQGMYLISKETERLWGLMGANTAHKKPTWYKTIDSADKLSNVLMCIASKLVLTDTDFDYKRIKIITFVVNSLFDKNDEASVKAGLLCVEWVIDECDLFTRHDAIVDGKTIVTFSLSSEVRDTIMDSLDYKAMNAFYCLPMIEKPLDWKLVDGEYIGGYHSKQLPLVKGGVTNDNSNLSIEVSNESLRALNIMQSTPWRINIDVLQALRGDLIEVQKSDYLKTPSDSDNKSQIDREKSLYATAVGKYNTLKMALNIAEDLKNEEMIYFPMNMDSRGRCYSLPIILQPQSESRIKALLEYSEGVVLTDDGIEQCYAYLCSLYGEDKLPYEDRVLLGSTLVEVDYKTADEPYEFLALQLEIKKYQEDSTSLIHAHIHLDMSNNAIQIMSAITGDYDGCVASNVIPTEDGRQDIYTDVAMAVLRDDLGETVVDDYIKTCLEENARKYSKKVVMTSAYGSTLYGDSQGVLNVMSELNYNPYYMNTAVSMSFARLLRASLASRIQGATRYMKWSRDLVKSTLTSGADCFTYFTNDGFKVVIRKDKMKTKSYVGKVNGKRYKLNLNVKTGDIDINKTVTSAVPSIIHSLDGAFLRELVRRGDDLGIVNWGVIHDAVAVNPNDVTKLHKIARETFIDVDHKNVLENIRLQSNSEFPKIVVGDLDITKVLESEWFFS